jgi:hypothetical protein
MDRRTSLLATRASGWSILLARDWWIFHLPKLPRYGWWSVLHEARADVVMLLGLVYRFIEGAGAWSLDARLVARRLASGGG